MTFRFTLLLLLLYSSIISSQENNSVLTKGNNPLIVLSRKWEGSYIHFNKSFSLNSSPIINSFFGIEMGIDYLFGDNLKIVYGSGIYLHNPLDNKNKNQDFLAEHGDFDTQYFIATTFNFVFYYYKPITSNMSLFFSGGFELLFTNGQSVSSTIVGDSGYKPVLLAKPYFFMYLYPQIGLNLENYNLEFFMSYNYSINTQNIYFDYFKEQKKYRLQFVTFGMRFLIPFIS